MPSNSVHEPVQRRNEGVLAWRYDTAASRLLAGPVGKVQQYTCPGVSNFSALLRKDAVQPCCHSAHIRPRNVLTTCLQPEVQLRMQQHKHTVPYCTILTRISSVSRYRPRIGAARVMQSPFTDPEPLETVPTSTTGASAAGPTALTASTAAGTTAVTSPAVHVAASVAAASSESICKPGRTATTPHRRARCCEQHLKHQARQAQLHEHVAHEPQHARVRKWVTWMQEVMHMRRGAILQSHTVSSSHGGSSQMRSTHQREVQCL